MKKMNRLIEKTIKDKKRRVIAMKKLVPILLVVMACGLWVGEAMANNAAVTNVSLINQNVSASTVDIKFDLSQDNAFSGTDANGQSFYDRVWIFVKFWKNGWATDGTVAWKHATFVSGGTITPASDGKGAFCQAGVNQTIRWQYSTDGLALTDQVKVRVMAIEMVYIPTGSFYVGSGGGEQCAFYKYPTTTNPYLISSEDAINVGATNDYLYHSTCSSGEDQAGPVPAAFPKGYNNFYIMKYEVSQGQYRDFLNTLTRTQQNTRTASQAANYFAMSNTTGVSSRNGIRVPALPGTGAITFGCDLNANGTFNEAGDGENVACNYLSWADLTAYADWAGLRPMTELEFEKACRGGGSAVAANEFAWGNTTVDYFSDLSSAGTSSEAIGPARPNANCNYNSAVPNGPVRCGMFATSSSSRATAGASYYGVMELSGNLWERSVTMGKAVGRVFTGLHGNGTLNTAGDANVTNWPYSGGNGGGLRGGGWFDDSGSTPYVRASDRHYAALESSSRGSNYGGRLARTP